MVQKLCGFKDFSRSLGMRSTIINAAKSAQICPKLPKTAQRQLVQETLKFHQKFEILVFFQKKMFLM
jgi:hypothetical protein